MTATEQHPPSEWAAPTGLASLRPVSVVLPPDPPRAHVGPVVALVVATVAILVAATAVTTVAVRESVGPARFSVERAIEHLDAAPGLRLDTTSWALESTFHVQSTTDTALQLVDVEMSFGSAGTAPGDSDAGIHAIVDAAHTTVYLGSDFFDGFEEEFDGKHWVRIQRSTLEDAGLDTSFFDQIRDVGATDLAALLVLAHRTTEVGTSRLRGEPVRVFDMVVRTADAPFLERTFDAQFDTTDAVIPDEITYTVSVSADNEVREVRYSLDFGIFKEKVVSEVETLGTAPPIELPADDDTVDARDLL